LRTPEQNRDNNYKGQSYQSCDQGDDDVESALGYRVHIEVAICASSFFERIDDRKQGLLNP
jgi:hypothetical protein